MIDSAAFFETILIEMSDMPKRGIKLDSPPQEYDCLPSASRQLSGRSGSTERP